MRQGIGARHSTLEMTTRQDHSGRAERRVLETLSMLDEVVHALVAALRTIGQFEREPWQLPLPSAS